MKTKAPTDNERIKLESDYLRGHIKETLADHAAASFSGDDAFLLKFLGATQQDDRDTRQARKKQGLERDYRFMLRLRLPGGFISPAQWLVMDELSEQWGNHTLKLTTRQSLQIHGVIKEHLRESMQGIHRAALGAIASSGDATRNVMCSTACGASPAGQSVLRLAQAVSRELEPQTHAYHEIWLNEERVFCGEEEPLYGKSYLPRKFKIAFTLPPHNDVDIFAHDLGFVAIEEGGVITGYTVLVGGGMGYAYGNSDSFPRIADVIGFCSPQQVNEVARAVLTIHRDFSDRTDRKLSRLRYTIASRGEEWFKSELSRRLGYALAAPRAFSLSSHADAQDTAPSRLLLFVEGGRVADSGERRLKSALREIARRHDGNFLVTANQNLLIEGLSAEARSRVDAILNAHGVNNDFSGLRLHSSSCSSLPFCPMAFADSERALPGLISALEPLLQKYGLWNEPINVRMSGCPNGCSRPFLAELAFVGRGPGLYNIWLGGAPNGSRLGFILRQSVKIQDIPSVLEPILQRFAATRQPNERFGDWTDAHCGELEGGTRCRTGKGEGERP